MRQPPAASTRGARPHLLPGQFWGGLTLALVLLTVGPYLALAVATPRGWHYLWTFIDPYDQLSYLAKIEQGRAGRWLYTDPYVARPQGGALVFLPYLALGHLAAWLGGPNLLWFHLARVSAALAAWSGAAWWLAARRVAWRGRLRAWLLALGGGGAGVLQVVDRPLHLDLNPLQVGWPIAALLAPHLVLIGPALAAVVAAAWSRQGSWRWPVGALGAAYLALVHAFWLPLLAVMAVPLWAARIPKEAPGAALRRWSLMLAPAVGLAAIQAWTLASVPWARTLVTPNVTSYSLPGLLAGLGLLLPLGAWGALKVWRRPGGSERWAVVWTLVAAAAFVLPFTQQRSLEGAEIPLAVLVGEGILLGVAPAVRRAALSMRRRLTSRERQLSVHVAALLLLFTPLVVSLGQTSTLLRSAPRNQLYLPSAEVSLLSCVAARLRMDEVVLTAPLSGAVLPGLGPGRVVAGHPIETVGADSVVRQVVAVYDLKTSSQERSALLRGWGVSWVLGGPVEHRLGTWSPTPAEGWQPVCAVEGGSAYRLR